MREGRLLLNEEERHSPYMQELENQFNLFDMTLPYCADGPDAVEGAVAITDRKERELSPVLTTSLRSLRQSNRTGWESIPCGWDAPKRPDVTKKAT